MAHRDHGGHELELDVRGAAANKPSAPKQAVAREKALAALRSPRSMDDLGIDTIRTLSMDAVQKADSGHPGAPMALAPVADTLWQRFLRFDPSDPIWPNRDRFVLSNGHASMLLYPMGCAITSPQAWASAVRRLRRRGGTRWRATRRRIPISP